MSDKYAEERRKPKVAACGTQAIKLVFDGKHLRMTGAKRAKGGNYKRKQPDGSLKYPAVSGKPDVNGSFDCSPGNQTRRNKGPIPQGEYWIKPSEMWERGFRHVLLGSDHLIAWGNYRITIHPYPSTKTHGRGGFFIHGGARPGSAGCIDLCWYMPDFVKDLRHSVGHRTNCYIDLSVAY